MRELPELQFGSIWCRTYMRRAAPWLRAECRRRGLAAGGSTAELRLRLADDDRGMREEEGSTFPPDEGKGARP